MLVYHIFKGNEYTAHGVNKFPQVAQKSTLLTTKSLHFKFYNSSNNTQTAVYCWKDGIQSKQYPQRTLD